VAATAEIADELRRSIHRRPVEQYTNARGGDDGSRRRCGGGSINRRRGSSEMRTNLMTARGSWGKAWMAYCACTAMGGARGDNEDGRRGDRRRWQGWSRRWAVSSY
jgi:hypothetical protein